MAIHDQQIGIRLEADMVRRLDEVARIERRSRSDMVRLLLDESLAGRGKIGDGSGQALDLAAALQERAYAAGNEALINEMLGKEAKK